MYKAYELGLIESKLNKKNKQILEDFLLFCASAGKSKKDNLRRTIVKCQDNLETDLDKLTPKILLEFLTLIKESDLKEASKNEVRKHFKRFVKWYYTDPKILKVLDQYKLKNDVNHERVNPETSVKEEEVELLMRGTDSIKYKTLIILSWETAGRPQEILDLKWEDINFENQSIKLRCSKKGGEIRVLPIRESLIHLERLREEWNFPNRTKEDFVFVGSLREQRLSNTQWESELKKISQKALNREVYPYLLRHGRLTIVQDILSSKAYEDFANHSLAVASRYRHPSQAKLLETMEKGLYDVKKLTLKEKNEIKELKKEVAELKEKLSGSLRNYLDEEMKKLFEENVGKIVINPKYKTLVKTANNLS